MNVAAVLTGGLHSLRVHSSGGSIERWPVDGGGESGGGSGGARPVRRISSHSVSGAPPSLARTQSSDGGGAGAQIGSDDENMAEHVSQYLGEVGEVTRIATRWEDDPNKKGSKKEIRTVTVVFDRDQEEMQFGQPPQPTPF